MRAECFASSTAALHGVKLTALQTLLVLKLTWGSRGLFNAVTPICLLLQRLTARSQFSRRKKTHPSSVTKSNPQQLTNCPRNKLAVSWPVNFCWKTLWCKQRSCANVACLFVLRLACREVAIRCNKRALWRVNNLARLVCKLCRDPWIYPRDHVHIQTCKWLCCWTISEQQEMTTVKWLLQNIMFPLCIP